MIAPLVLLLSITGAAPPAPPLTTIILPPPAGAVFGSATFSPDGATVTAGGSDARGGLIAHWRADTGKDLGRWRTSRFPAGCLAWGLEGRAAYSLVGGRPSRWGDGIEETDISPAQKLGDGEALAFVTAWPRLLVCVPGAVYSWDLASRSAEPPLRAPGRAAHPGVVSGDGRLWANLDHEDIDLYHLGTQKLHWPLGSHRGRVRAATFSTDGKRLACVTNLREDGGAWGATAYLWDVDEGKRRIEASLGMMRARAVALSPAFIAVLGAEGEAPTLRLLDARTGGETARLLLPHASGTPEAVAFSPDGKSLALCLSKGVRLIRVKERP